jgi:hypothetical protein
LGIVMDISKFEITNYEVGWVWTFKKCYVERGFGFWKSRTRWVCMHIYRLISVNTQLILSEKKILAPCLCRPNLWTLKYPHQNTLTLHNGLPMHPLCLRVILHDLDGMGCTCVYLHYWNKNIIWKNRKFWIMFTNGYVCAHQLKNQIIPFSHLKQNLMLGKFKVFYIHWKNLVTKLKYKIFVINICWNQIVFLISILRLVIVWIWGLGFRVECKFVGLYMMDYV